MKTLYAALVMLICVVLIVACQSEQPPIKEVQKAEPIEKIKSQIVRVNQLEIKRENDEMDAYEKTHLLKFIKSNSGIRYFVYKHSDKGDSIKNNMQVTIHYELKLLDGTLCYTSKTEGPKQLVVGADEAESGLHKGLLFLKRGDKAIFLIPSVLAHGLLGDFNKIPPQMPIVFDVAVQ